MAKKSTTLGEQQGKALSPPPYYQSIRLPQNGEKECKTHDVSISPMLLSCITFRKGVVTSLVRTDLLFLSAAIFISVFEQKLH